MGVSQNVTLFYVLRMYYVMRSIGTATLGTAKRNISQNVKHNAKRNKLTQIVILIVAALDSKRRPKWGSRKT